MKEPPIEEKAKRYDEALKKAKDMLSYKEVRREDIEYLFPELKESEDERIRIALCLFVEAYGAHANYEATREEMLAWLEKQGNIDKVSYDIAEKEKREFVGDGFIKCHADFQDFKEGETYWLEYVGNDNYNVRSDNLLGKTYHITPCQLYTIFKKQTWFEKQGEKPQGKTALEAANKEKVDNAAKVEHKPAWSEEDKEMFNRCIKTMKGAYYQDGKALRWLEGRFKSFILQNNWKPSDEQMKALNTCIMKGEISYVGQGTELQSLYNDLMIQTN